MNLRDAHVKLCSLLEEASKCFNGEPKLTLVVRHPSCPDGGIVLTDDTLDDAIAQIERLRNRPEQKLTQEDVLKSKLGVD